MAWFKQVIVTYQSSMVIVTYQLTCADMAWYRYEKLALPLRHSTDMVRVKNNTTICKMCAPHFDKKTCCTFMISSGFVWEAPECGIAVLFAKRTTIWQTRRIFTAKGVTILALRRFTRRHTAAQPSKCGTHGGKKATHMTPCFQVLLRHVCCILFDAYRMFTLANITVPV